MGRGLSNEQKAILILIYDRKQFPKRYDEWGLDSNYIKSWLFPYSKGKGEMVTTCRSLSRLSERGLIEKKYALEWILTEEGEIVAAELYKHRDSKRLRASKIKDDWRREALKFLYQYAKTHREFSGEMVRNASWDKVKQNPFRRAWGSIMVAGKKRDWIRQVGYVNVINPRCQKGVAACWRSELRGE